MAKKSGTVFQALDKAITGNWNPQDTVTPHVNTYDMSGMGKDVIYRTSDKEEYLSKKLELQQNKYLKDRWIKANVNLSVTAYAGLNNVKLMYRDADLMDAFPEIGAALDIVSEESTITNDKGMIVNVYSKSDRIKSILEDLFVNRLNIQLTGQMIIRAMCKYGNQFMLLDIDNKNGIKGWKQMPVFNMERIENGIQNPYGAGASIAVNGITKDNADMSTQFIWLDDNNSQIPFRDWQIAHFRLLNNSLYLPYGCLVGDTRIETEFGYKELFNISIGDKVWTFNINSQKRELGTVTMFMPKGEKDVYKVSTFHNEIEGTEDHKLLVYENNSLIYKEIKDIKVNDLLIIDNSYNKCNGKVKINKEIRNYSENIFFGLSLRQFIFSILACTSALILFFIFKPVLGTEIASWICIIGAIPFGIMGFVKYNGMTGEQFILAYIKSEFLTKRELVFEPTNFYYELINTREKEKTNESNEKSL